MVAGAEEWLTAMQVRVLAWRFARVRRARKVFWATVSLATVSLDTDRLVAELRGEREDEEGNS